MISLCVKTIQKLRDNMFLFIENRNIFNNTFKNFAKGIHVYINLFTFLPKYLVLSSTRRLHNTIFVINDKIGIQLKANCLE